MVRLPAFLWYAVGSYIPDVSVPFLIMASAAADLRGCTQPRIFTPPLRRLTPSTSAGYAILGWAKETLGWEPLPWQAWWLVHAHELLKDGTPRFRTVLTLCA